MFQIFLKIDLFKSQLLPYCSDYGFEGDGEGSDMGGGVEGSVGKGGVEDGVVVMR